MAKLWNLPVIYLLENNNYAMGTSVERAAANPEFYKRYDNIPGIRVDGHNVLAMREYMNFAKEYALENGPIFVEARTYRYHGHSMSDPGTTYRDRQEIIEVIRNIDCINQFKTLMLENDLIHENQFKGMEREIKRTVDDAIRQATRDPEPPLEELWTDITDDKVGSVFLRSANYEDSVFPGGEIL